MIETNVDPVNSSHSGSTLSTDPSAELKGRYMREVDPAKVDMMTQSLQEAVSRMQSLGAVIVDPADINFQPYIDLGFQALKTLYANEFKEGITKYLADMASTDVKELQDIIE
jgi:hypothetical protein